MTTQHRFNDVGFISPDLADFAHQVRCEFAIGFSMAERLNRLAMKMLFAIPTEDANDEQALGAACYGKAIQSFQAALVLAERGTLAESRALVRLCAEAVFAVGALMRVPGTAVQMREGNDRHRRALANAVLVGDDDGNKPDAESTARLQQVIAEIDGNYASKSRPINWEILAQQAGLRGPYIMAYRLTSGDSAHITLGSLDRHVIADENHKLLGFSFRPDKSDLKETLEVANAAISSLLDLAVEWFELNEFKAEMRECLEQWKKTAD
jgi:hypothetical protein